MNETKKVNTNEIDEENDSKICKKIDWKSLLDPKPRGYAIGEDEKLLYDPNIIKLLYNEAGTMFRHFLNLRRLLFGGYFAILYTLILALKWSILNTNGKFISALILVMGFFVSIVFLLLEIRNRSLYRIASITGSRIEKSLCVGDIGYYEIHNKLKAGDSCIRHSYVIGFLYVLCAILMLGLSIAILCDLILLDGWIPIPQETQSDSVQYNLYN